jgi:hypothetical protein
MFDQMKNLKQLASLLGNAEQIKERMEQMQERLGSMTVDADAGAGAVRVLPPASTCRASAKAVPLCQERDLSHHIRAAVLRVESFRCRHG